MLQLGEVHKLETADGKQLWFPSNSMRIIAYGNYGAPPTEFVTQKIYKQDGVSEIDYTTGPRSIVLRIFKDYTDNRLEYWNARSKLHEYFRPNRNGKLKLTLRLPSGDLRTLDVRAEPGLEFGPKEDNSWIIDESIGLIAHDPIWYDPIPDKMQLNGFYGADLVFPAEFPITFGPSGLQYITQVNYTGTWKTPVIMKISGPYSRIDITNMQTRKRITLDVPIGVDEVRTITLKPGETDIVDQNGESKYGEFGPASNLVDFAIHPVPEVPEGSNNGTHYLKTKTYMPARYYRFGEPQGSGAAIDFGGDLEAGVYTGSITLDHPGALGDDPDTAIYFDGTNSNLIIPPIDLDYRSFTFEFFYKPEASDTLSGSNRRIIFTLATVSETLTIFYFPSLGRMFVTKGIYSCGTTVGHIINGSWNHVMVVYDHLTGLCRMYINGQLSGSDILTDITTATQSCVISTNQSGVRYPLFGGLDEFAIYLRAFQSDEVLEKYESYKACDMLYRVGGKQIIQANVSGARGSGYLRTILRSSPNRYYRFGEIAGATGVRDIGLDGATGTAVNCTFQQPGAIPKDSDNAVAFNGTDSLITIPDPVLYLRSYTIEWWMNPNATASFNCPWSFLASGSPGESLFCLYTNANEILIYNSYTYGVSSPANSVLPGEYTYCVYTYDNLSNTASLYLNGELVDTDTSVDISVLFDLQSGIGAFNLLSDFYDGILDEFAIYYYALTPETIKAHYQSRLRRFAAEMEITYNKRFYGV